MHCGDAEALAIIGKQVTEFCLTEAARVGQNSLKDGLKVAWRTGDRAEYLGGRRLLLQRLGKLPARLGELTGARFELLFQLDQRIGPAANVRSRLRSDGTKLATSRVAFCALARQGHPRGGTSIGPDFPGHRRLKYITAGSPACQPFAPSIRRTNRFVRLGRLIFLPGPVSRIQ